MVNLPVYASALTKKKRFKVLKGGRGSAKSFTVARLLLLEGYDRKCFILCAREFQNSMNDSVHKLLCEQIEDLNLQKFYKITKDSIIGNNGTKFIFKGVYGNINSIKSIPGITHAWIEEAQTMSKISWEILEPTIREEGSEIWVTYNPEKEDDPTHVKFCGPDGPPPNSIVIEANWKDNPWFPDVLKNQMLHMKRTNYDLYMHIWEGETRSSSDAQIFKDKFFIEDFDVNPNWDGPYFGADWGFSVDPTVLVKIYIDLENNHLLFSEETGGVGIDMDDIPELFDQVSEVRSHMIRADNARPETISYVSRKGFLIEAAAKWKGSIEDGIEFMKTFDKIIIHGRCAKTSSEFRNYSYKIDRLTGDITTIIMDDYNHYLDAARYALEPLISEGRNGLLAVL